MNKTQISLIELLESPREVDRLNRELLQTLDGAKEPETAEENAALAQKLANQVSRRIHELMGIQRTIGVELEFVGQTPRIKFFTVGGGCSSC